MAATREELLQRIYWVVSEIPTGRVATYGQIARLAEIPGGPRFVGKAMAELPEGHGLPWQRVVNASGRSSLPGAAGDHQRELLRREGVEVRPSGSIDLRRFGWQADDFGL